MYIITMIKTLIKYKIYDACIETFFTALTKNVTPNIVEKTTGEIYMLGGRFFFEDDRTGIEYMYDEDMHTWINTEDQREVFIDEQLYKMCCNADLEDILDDDTGSFS